MSSATLVRPPGTRSRSGHPSLVLAVILTCQLMVVLDATIVNIALPSIRSALHFSAADLSWVINAYTLSFGGLLLLGARAGDILGRRRTFLIGIGLFSLASLLGGFAARAAQGVGGALASPSALALLLTGFREGRERTRALAWYTAVSIGGAAVGLIAGGMLTQWLSWRWVLFVNVPIGIAVVVIARLTLPDTPTQHGRFDLAGALTATSGMTALVFGFVHAATHRWTDPATLAAFTGGLFLLAAFVLIELRATAPITPLRLFASRNRSSSYLARLLLVAGMMGMFFFLTQFLQGVLHYSALRTGLAFLPLTAAVFTSSQVGARLLNRSVSGKVLMVSGLTLSTVGLWWLSHLAQGSGYPAMLGPLLLFGTGNGLAFVPLTTVSLAGVAPADAGAASGLVNVMQQVGGSLGLAVLVSVYGTASRSAAHDLPAGASAAQRASHAFVVGADRGFLVAAAILAATVLLIAFAIRGQRPPPSVGTTSPAEAAAEAA